MKIIAHRIEIQTLLAATSQSDLPTLERLQRDRPNIHARGSLKEMTEYEGEELTILEIADIALTI